MRRELRERLGRRGHFSATFVRFGVRRKGGNWPVIRTALLRNVRDERGDEVADHLWMCVGKQLDLLRLVGGDEIFFVARVSKYTKRNPELECDQDAPPRVTDYRLSNPTNIRKLGVDVTRELPLYPEEE